MMTINKSKIYNRLIIVVSVAIPIVVAILFTVKIPNATPLNFLPPIYATINAITAVLLIFALRAIKSGKRLLHERLMKVCMGLLLVFLVMYIAYHMTSDSTPYGGEGFIAYVYYFILISHIILAIVLIPMVLTSYVRAIQRQFDPHKKIAKITFPVWLYVTITGVIVYLMISPYY